MADKKKTKQKVEIKEPKGSWVDFFHLDESYTSLLLGVVVVIIASILVVSFVKNRHIESLHQVASSISLAPTAAVHNLPLTISPTPAASTATPVPTIMVKSTVVPTAMPTIAPTSNVIKAKLSIKTPVQIKPAPIQTKGGETYTVKTGDDLWHIAERTYGSGYNWVDIASANNLKNPSMLYSGTVLKLPKVSPKTTTTIAQNITTSTNGIQHEPKITTKTYAVQKGDSLWTISQRAYNGDGYQWTKIAQVNHLANPSLIFSGNVLIIPRE